MSKSYTLKVYTPWVSSFYRICFWKASGSRETPARFFCICKNYDCSRGVAELLARLSVVAYCYAIQQVGVLWLSVSNLPIAQHSNSMPSALPPHTNSCSAQTLRRVSSLIAVLRKSVYKNLFLEGGRQS